MNEVEGNRNLILYRHLFAVYASYQGGLTIMARWRKFTVFNIVPDICFIQIGENELAKNLVTVDKLISLTVTFVDYLIVGVGVRRVVAGQLFLRQPWAVKSKTYEDDIKETNSALEAELRQIDGAYFWHHREF